GSVVVLSLPIGGFIAAWPRGTFALKLPQARATGRFLASGLAMGISAAIAGGCNIGHTFSGAPTLAISSLLASLSIFLGAGAGNWLRFIRPANPLPPLHVERRAQQT
ncbi:MAG: YeeE/YedE family protein, partial [Anaerolineae bacterium]|nr:YeeE/YedE family protein [Anaerolineae bacterium]